MPYVPYAPLWLQPTHFNLKPSWNEWKKIEIVLY